MRLSMRWTWRLIAGSLLLAAGCGPRLKVTKTVEVKPGECKGESFELPLVNQATVTVSSPGRMVDVYVVQTVFAQKTTDDILNGKPLKDKDLLVSTRRAEKATLVVKPEKKEFSVLIYNSGRGTATVEVSVTGD